MHVYFSGIGGAGLAPLAEIAQDAGYKVSGSDLHESLGSKELERRGVDVVYEQTRANIEAEHLANPIDWLVHTSAIKNSPELDFAREHGIKISKRDEFLSAFLDGNLGLDAVQGRGEQRTEAHSQVRRRSSGGSDAEMRQELIAIAGTHGKTTTTGMLVWAFQELGMPVSYSIGTTISFGPSGKYARDSSYFVYEADEYDRNFLKFHPAIAVLPSVDYDHADIFPSVEDYKNAFRQFISQSELTMMFEHTKKYLEPIEANCEVFSHTTPKEEISLAGQFRRDDAYLVKQVLLKISDFSEEQINEVLGRFPGTSRRFEELSPGLITDYAHHPTEIKVTIEMALELNKNVVVVYEPHQNERQLKLIDQYKDIFTGVKHLYWLPTFMPPGDREKSKKVLAPDDLIKTLNNTSAEPAEMNNELWNEIETHLAAGNLVVGMSAGNLDAWLREKVIE